MTAPPPTEHIGQTLRRTRREREHSQEQVALLLGVTQSTLSRIERAQLDPPRASFDAIATYLTTPGEHLVTWFDVDIQVDVHNLQQREAALVEALDEVRSQLTEIAQEHKRVMA